MMERNRFFLAVEDFRQARRDAALEEIVARLRGRSAALLPFEQVRQQLKARGSQVRGLQEIRLDAIVGSVGRYSDFTRSFLPRRDSDEERWARVQVAMSDLGQFSPIDVYQIGEAYFVIDGNHRVSIARQLGAKSIQANVIELESKVSLSPDDNPNDFIIKAEYADFLEQTKLDELRPAADLQITVAGGYQALLEQLETYHDYIARNREDMISYTEVVAQWYDEVYLPVIEIIRRRGILREFAGRTETDLYRWIIKHRAALQEQVGWHVPSEAVVSDLTAQYSPTTPRMVARLGAKVKDALALHDLMGGPEPGLWRKEHIVSRRKDHLLTDILVALSGNPSEWEALEQALLIAKREEARILGLHITPLVSDRVALRRLEDEFQSRCEEAGVVGELAIEYGTQAAALICDRARWSDLVVTKLAHPPAPQPLAKIKSGFRRLVRRSPRPLLAVPAGRSQLEHPLLAYDGSPKAKEALFLAAYLAGKWQKALSVITIETAHTNEQQLEEARRYLEKHNIQANYLYEQSTAADAILRAAEHHNCDLIIMGGYGFGFMRELVLGSAVDGLLRSSQIPMLICR
jgi:nucleotide-binding universal stress UspA family protein